METVVSGLLVTEFVSYILVDDGHHLGAMVEHRLASGPSGIEGTDRQPNSPGRILAARSDVEAERGLDLRVAGLLVALLGVGKQRGVGLEHRAQGFVD
ncbi:MULTISPECIES: hypothetical protein [Gordonia]|uniref:hypothetical protein n=1 Tax=Gordonia TaxID=2053 RepID=UPI00130DAEC8|nr:MULTISPECIES: hypothetical protein [Gordonia]MCZ4580450.1 hypothetical protein [Gordonia amicalis]